MKLLKQYVPSLYLFLKGSNAHYLNAFAALVVAGLFIYLVWLIVDSGILARRVASATEKTINNMQSNMKT